MKIISEQLARAKIATRQRERELITNCGGTTAQGNCCIHSKEAFKKSTHLCTPASTPAAAARAATKAMESFMMGKKEKDRRRGGVREKSGGKAWRGF